ncbi:iron-containing alcohol dehydrogenase [bacterium]|nr:iron-containing alcohol dehydrogenase [bacterium]
MPRFTVPRDIYFGRECIERLSTIRGKRAMLITAGGDMEQNGSLARVEAVLQRTGMEVRLLRSQWPEAAEQAVAEGAAKMHAFAPDWIIAHGSAAISAGKLMWILFEYPEAVLSDLRRPFGLPELRRKARFAAIPSFGGGAPEATAFAELSGSLEQSAWAAMGYEIVPDIVFIDPAMSAGVLPAMAAETGMETIAYAADAYCAPESTPFTDAAAQKAAELALRFLCGAYAGESAAQEQLHYAQCLAGMAFSNAAAGLTHALSRQCCGIFQACRAQPGAVRGIFLPLVIRFHAADSDACARYAALARALGLRGRGEAQAAQALAEEIEVLRTTLGLPGTLREMGVSEEEFLRCRRTAAVRVAEDFCAKANPRNVQADRVEALLNAAFGEDE